MEEFPSPGGYLGTGEKAASIINEKSISPKKFGIIRIIGILNSRIAVNIPKETILKATMTKKMNMTAMYVIAVPRSSV